MAQAISSAGSAGSYNPAIRPPNFSGQRPDPTKLAEQAFAKLDIGNKGYLDQADLQQGFSQISGPQGSSGSADDKASRALKALDSDGDGKLSKDEFSSGVKKVADALDQQFNQSRVKQGQGAGGAEGANGPPAGGPPPGGPPPGAGPQGAQGAGGAEGGTDSTSSTSSTSTTYDPADSNKDGTVSQQELLAYQQSSAYISKQPDSGSDVNGGQENSSRASSGSRDSGALEREGGGRRVEALNLLRLVQAYGGETQNAASINTAA
jgi:hypothetical protein